MREGGALNRSEALIHGCLKTRKDDCVNGLGKCFSQDRNRSLSENGYFGDSLKGSECRESAPVSEWEPRVHLGATSLVLSSTRRVG